MCPVLSMAYDAVFIGVYIGVTPLTPLHPFGRRPVCAIRKIRLSPPESHRRAAVKARL